MSIKRNVRLAKIQDIPTLQQLDAWPSLEVWQRKIEAQEVIVLEIDKLIVGLARYTTLWTSVPFLGLIRIQETYRGKGYSKAMLEFLKNHLRDQGFVALLSSSQTNEPEPQAWHIHMGFKSNGIIENIDDEGIGELIYRLVL